MSDISQHQYLQAAEDFRRARREAALEEVLARLRGRSADLLPFDEVRQKLRGTSSSPRGLREIPLAAIVGSVGRYTDFTRSFLPRRQSDQERWSRVQVAMTELGRFAPIEVYQIGDVYFVVDGNHRVSIAHQLGLETIPAYVTEIQTKVPLSITDQPDDLILKTEYADFLAHTDLDEQRPGADLRVTVPDRYREFLDQIAAHQYYLGQEQGEAVTFQEAAARWYDEVYQPAVEAIHQSGLLRDFPGRTEADLYAWLSRHRALLQAALGWEVAPEAAATDLAAQHSSRPGRVAARIGERLKEALTPPELDSGPNVGQWRRERLAARRADQLFKEILVPLSGEEVSWQALEQAIVVAQREEGRLLGLHVIPSELRLIQPETKALEAEFNRRCAAAGVPGAFVFEVGVEVAARICDRARWLDLITLNLAHPPAAQPIERLKSGFRTLIRRSPRPVLATPGTVSPLDRALLAYDGSAKAEEALFVATYLASRWGMALHVLTVVEKQELAPAPLTQARAYLETHGVEATYLQATGPVADSVLQQAAAHTCNLIIMGGYGFGSVREVVLGSAVDQVLRHSPHPTLICR